MVVKALQSVFLLFSEIMNAQAHTLLLLLLLEVFTSANAFSFDGHAFGSHSQTRLHSSISFDDEMSLPSGGFDITRTHPRAAVSARDAAAEFSLEKETLPLIPSSSKHFVSMPPAETVSYDEDLDLPYRSLTYDADPVYEALATVELSVSRMAMIAALGLFSAECTTGTSVLDQILSMIG